MTARRARPAPTSDPKKPRIIRLLGPGLITGASDDDPSGIATYSQAGAQFGFAISWTMLFSYPLMVAIQQISARIGRTTGKGIAGNLRQHGSVRLFRHGHGGGNSMARGGAGFPASDVSARRRVLDDSGCRAGDHHQPLFIFLAGSAGGRGHSGRAGTQAASEGAPSRGRTPSSASDWIPI
jgi:hypothetical protein